MAVGTENDKKASSSSQQDGSNQGFIDREFNNIVNHYDDQQSRAAGRGSSQRYAEPEEDKYDRAQQYYNDKFNDIVGNQQAAKNLQNKEADAGSAARGVQDAENFANNPTNATNAATATKEKEQDSGWQNNVTGKDKGKDGQTEGKFKGGKKGPVGLIIALVLGGGIFGIGTIGPSLGLINFKELLVQKLDSMTAVISARSDQGMALRLYSDPPTTASCKIKVKCRFKGLSERQMQRLEIIGASLVDANGNKVTKDILGRYSGGKKLILPDGKAVDASLFKQGIRDPSFPELRSTVRKVFAPRWTSWNDEIAKKIRAAKKVPTNPKWGKEGDEKDAKKELLKAVGGESGNANVKDNTIYQQENGTDKVDENGNKIPVTQAPGAEGLDFGDDTENINSEAENLKKKVADGIEITSLPDDTVSAAMLDEYKGKASAAKGFKSVVGFLNPADALVGLCTTYQIMHTIVLLARIYGVTQTIRVLYQYAATADKFKAGQGTSDDMQKAMSFLQKPDDLGNAYGDGFSYNYVAYNKVTDLPLGASSIGNDVVVTMATILSTVNNALGGRTFVKEGCNILQNPVVIGLLSLSSFIPGAGQITNSVGKVVGKGGVEVAKGLIKKAIEEVVKNTTKDALKSGFSKAKTELLKIAKSPEMAIFLGGYLLERYGVPYMAQTLAGTEFVGANGAKTADAMANGADAMNSITAQSRAMQPLSKEEYVAYNKYQKETTDLYIADMQAETDPYDLTDPYSKSSRMLAAFFPITSRLSAATTNPSRLLSVPSAILSGLSISSLLGGTSYAAEVDTNAELSYCQDSFLQENDLATSPYCNVKYGFSDIAMLTNTHNPDIVIDWMHTNKHIDDDGNAIDGSKFATFKSTCVDGTENKFIGDVGDSTDLIDSICYKKTENQTLEYKMFRLYLIDSGVANAMDNGPEVPKMPEKEKTTFIDFYDSEFDSSVADLNLSTAGSTP